LTGLKALTDPEREIILECLKFIAAGVRFEMDVDCLPRIGLSVQEFHNVMSEWPDVIDAAGTDAFLAINNSLNEVCSICSDPDDPTCQKWSKYFSATPDEVEAVFDKWTLSLGMDWTGLR